MKQLADLAATLQVGVHRSPPPRSEPLSEWPEGSPEKGLLVDLAALSLMARAGHKGRPGLPAIPASPEEEKPYALSSSDTLLEALDKGDMAALSVWAEEAEARGFLAPPSVLVRLLGLAPQHRKALRPALGARAAWLASLMGVDLDESAAPVPDDLEAAWPTLDWKERRDLLACLRPSLEDEPFLVRAAQDRKSEVRQAAALLLVRLEGSALQQEIRSCLKGRVSLDPSDGLIAVEVPDPSALPKLLPRPEGQPPTMGPAALALFRLASFLPLAFWEEELGMGPGEIAARSHGALFEEALFHGWAESALFYQAGPEWSDVLLQTVSTRIRQALALLSSGSASRSSVSQARSVSINCSSLRHRLMPLASDQVMEEALASPDLSPLEALSLAVARGRVLTPQASQHLVEKCRRGDGWAEAGAARIFDLSVLPLFQDPWPEKAEPLRQKWLPLLDLRSRILRSLEP